MSTDNPDELSREFEQRLKAMSKELSSVVRYAPPKEIVNYFVSLQSQLFVVDLSVLQHLAPTPAKPKDWLHRFRSGLLDSVQEGILASHYHLWCVENLERDILAVASKYATTVVLKAGATLGVGHGNTRALTYEYQAFIFAIRRTLDYLAYAVAAYFRCDGGSIRDLARTIKRSDPEAARERVTKVIEESSGLLEAIVPTDKENVTSIRDTLAHSRAINAGTLNIVRDADGIRVALYAGGHELEGVFGNSYTCQVVQDGVSVMSVLQLSLMLEKEFRDVSEFMRKAIHALGLSSD